MWTLDKRLALYKKKGLRKVARKIAANHTNY